MHKKQLRQFNWDYVINYNENETEYKKLHHIDTT